MLFDAYGKLVSTPTYQRQTVSLSPECPFQYKGQVGYISPDLAGKPNDTGLGLVNCMKRWYDPLSGRWLTRDPTGYDGGENAHEYCDGNPLTLADADGCLSEPWWQSLKKRVENFDITSFAAGAGDEITWGGTKIARKYIGNALGIGDANEAVGYNGGEYGAGEWFGFADTALIGGAGGWEEDARQGV